ncbi:MAG: GNAT family N-acetyltransferase [Actinomycetes bacterium]
MTAESIVVRPVGPAQWPQLAAFFGPSGAYSGCWCMWWRRTSAEFDAGCRDGATGNRAALQRLTADGRVPGLLAYDGDVWAAVCFWVPRGRRGRGVATALLAGAVDHARAAGARVLEGYPVDPSSRVPSADLYTGTLAMFRRAGFNEVRAPTPSGRRHVVRLPL